MSENAFVPPDIASMMGIVDTHLQWRQEKEKGSRKYFKYHPSEWGGCLREQQYKHFVQLGYVDATEENHSSQMARLFETGHATQARWEIYFDEIGILRGLWKCTSCKHMHGTEETLGIFNPGGCEKCDAKAPLRYCEVSVIDEELNFSGHADCILDFSRFDPSKYEGVRQHFNMKTLPKRPVVVDMKTCNEWSWKKQVQSQGVHKKYRIQILIYAHILDCEYGVVIYENKNNSAASAFKVERNDELFDTIRWQAKAMQELSKRKKLPPPKPADKESKECNYCDFRSICYTSPIWENEEALTEKRVRFYKNLL